MKRRRPSAPISSQSPASAVRPPQAELTPEPSSTAFIALARLLAVQAAAEFLRAADRTPNQTKEA